MGRIEQMRERKIVSYRKNTIHSVTHDKGSYQQLLMENIPKHMKNKRVALS